MFGRLRGSEEKRMEFRVINNSHTELQNLSIIAVVVIDSINWIGWPAKNHHMLYARLNLCNFEVYIYNFVSGLPCNQDLGDISEEQGNLIACLMVWATNSPILWYFLGFSWQLDVAWLYSSRFLFGLLSKATVEFDVRLFFSLDCFQATSWTWIWHCLPSTKIGYAMAVWQAFLILQRFTTRLFEVMIPWLHSTTALDPCSWAI